MILMLVSKLIEGSSLTLKMLITSIKGYLVTLCPDLECDPIILEQLVLSNATRKCYGIKQKEEAVYTNSDPMAFWCWEIENKDLLRPYPDALIMKIRNARGPFSKKLILLKSLVEDGMRLKTEKDLTAITKNFVRYNKMCMDEKKAEGPQNKKRKYSEMVSE